MNAKVGWIALVASMACSDDDSSATSPAARGQYLVDHVAACTDCHTPRDAMGAPIEGQYLAGTECFAQLPNGSCLNPPNLTHHETGLLNRSDAEIGRMIRDGIRPTAAGEEPLSPVMPYYAYHNMSDEDLDAVVAYLRTVPGVDHAVPPSGPEFEVPAAANPLDPGLIPMPIDGYPERSAALRGRYLAGEIGVCLECHTRHVMGDPNVLDYAGIFAGGEPFQVGLPVTPISSNLTSDAQTGLGDWTVEGIVQVLLQGIDDEGHGVCPPMPVGPMGAFGGLTPADAQDIAHYIKSLPPIVNAIDDACTSPPM
ncbi:MAG TPA: c-type cytochrome [Polyangiaceae bacterium]|jgi:mono/diheme cytochrome c family protein|nr:c-type cytochrome [Polyangiaceae bacterium]